MRNALFFGLILFWLASLLLACFYGSYPLEGETVLSCLGDMLFSSSRKPSFAHVIVSDIRLSRALLSSLAGGALSCAGVILQACLRSRLADPFTLGISQGAAFGASLILTGSLPLLSSILPPSFAIALAAFLGALLATLATLLLASSGNADDSHIILSGIAVATFLGALVALFKALNEESVTSIVFWIMGSFQGKTWQMLPLLLVTSLPSLFLLCFLWRSFDLMLLGDTQAQHMGVNVKTLRLLAISTAALLTSGCVAVAGVIGFVGLVVPHILRLLLGSRHGPLLIASFFGGGILLLWSDVLARSLLPEGQEIPVGVVTALLGGPFFAFLLRKKNA